MSNAQLTSTSSAECAANASWEPNTTPVSDNAFVLKALTPTTMATVNQESLSALVAPTPPQAQLALHVLQVALLAPVPQLAHHAVAPSLSKAEFVLNRNAETASSMLEKDAMITTSRASTAAQVVATPNLAINALALHPSVRKLQCPVETVCQMQERNATTETSSVGMDAPTLVKLRLAIFAPWLLQFDHLSVSSSTTAPTATRKV